MKILLITLLAAHLGGCKPDDVPPQPVKVEEGNPIIWKTALNSNDLVSPPLYYENLIIFSQDDEAKAFNSNTGELVWEKALNARPLDFQGTFIVNDKIVFSDSRRIYVLNPKNGNILWQDEIPDGRNRACSIGNYLYKVSDKDDNSQSTLFRYDIDKGIREKVFTLHRGEFEPDHSPGLLMPVTWSNSSGDDLLIMGNRSFGWGTTGANRLDILAWNVTADSMEWYRNLDGFSSTARPVIDGDNVYFYGDRHAYCINPVNGETRWKYFIGDGPEDDFNTANIIIVKDKLIVKPDNRHMHAVDKETGTRIWLNEEVVSMPYMLTQRNDTIWLANAGVFGIDAKTGEKVIDDWKGSRSGSWIFPVALHPTNGLIYTSDGDYLYCLNPKYMK